MLVEWYVARTNQIATLGYVSRTNYITAFAYLEPITTFRVCVWHKSDCRIYLAQSYYSKRISWTSDSFWKLFSCKWSHGIRGLYTKNRKKLYFLGSIISLMVCGLRESLVE